MIYGCRSGGCGSHAQKHGGQQATPTLENSGKLLMASVSMPCDAASLGHLRRLSCLRLELSDHQGCCWSGPVGVAREGERWIACGLDQDQPACRAVPAAGRPHLRFDAISFLPLLRRSLVLVFVASLFIQIFSLAQPLIIQQIIDKVIGQQNFNTLYFLGVLLIGCSVISNILNLIRTFLFTDTTNRIDIATSGNILTHLFKLPLGYFDRRPVGEISTRLAELGSIRGFLTGTALTLILDVIFGIVYFFVLISYSGLLTAVSLSVVPLYLAMVFIVPTQLRVAAKPMLQQVR